MTSGYPVGELVNILLKPDTSTHTVQGVFENAAFVVDVELVDLQDLKADAWHPTGT